MSQVVPKGFSEKKKKEVPRVMLIRLEKDVTIKASSAVAFPGSYSYVWGEEKDVVIAEGNEKLYNDGVLMASTLHKVGSEGKVSMVLQVFNTTKNDVTYNGGQVIGTVQAGGYGSKGVTGSSR